MWRRLSMRALTAPLTAFAAAAALVFATGTADAACKKMGFLVNDYGKDGPTKDAKDLLDKHVAEWAAQNGITKYTIGKKDVTCELYLNLIIFDEHTCTASANVCWDEPGKSKPDKTAKEKETPDTTKSAASEKKSSESKPAVEKQKAAETPAVTPAAIETGTLPAETAAQPTAAPPTAADDAATRAAAAAERAADAAERAAAAAEKAASAAGRSEPTPSQLEMPAFGAGKPADVAPVTPVEPKS